MDMIDQSTETDQVIANPELSITQKSTEIDPKEMKQEDRRELGESHYKMGKIYYDKSDLENAKQHFDKALSLCFETGDFFFEFKTLGFLIRIASEMLDQELSESYIRRSELIVDRAMSELGSLNSEVFYNAGVAKTYRGNFAEAFQNFEMAIQSSRSENEPDILAKSYYALASGNFQMKNLEKSLEYLGQLSEILKILGKTYLKGTLNLLYGNIYSELGDYDKALNFYSGANNHFMNKACWNLYGYILLGRGTIFKKMGKYNKSLWYFQMALDAINPGAFRRLDKLVNSEISDVNDSNVDIYLDRNNRMVHEKNIGTVDFKHRFVLLEILFLLARNPGVYYDKDKLSRMIWKDEYNPLIHDKLIYTSISRLRKLIEPKTEKKKYIIRGKDGYAFNPYVNTRFNREANTSVGSLGNIDISSPV